MEEKTEVEVGGRNSVEVREGVAADVEGEAVEGEEVDEDGSEAAAARAQARSRASRNAAIADANPHRSFAAVLLPPTVSCKIVRTEAKRRVQSTRQEVESPTP